VKLKGSIYYWKKKNVFSSLKGCICKAGWEGTDCTVNVNECSVANICNDDYKNCVDTLGSYRCDCIQHYQLNTETDKCDGENFVYYHNVFLRAP
jgi:hypothetical protein